MRHQIRAALFALDGVTAYTDKYHYLAWKKLASEKGWFFDKEVNLNCRGISCLASLQVILDHNNIELTPHEKNTLANTKDEYYKELLNQLNSSNIYPGIVFFLQKLRDKEIRLAICSSSRNVLKVLTTLNLMKYFDAVIIGNDIKTQKPDPGIFLKGAEAVNIHPLHCLVFSDSESGVRAAHASNIKSIRIGNADQIPNAKEIITDFNGIDLQSLLDTGRVKAIKSELWNITEDKLQKNRFRYWESAFALSNGIFGVRGTFEESIPGYDEYPATFVNGICGYEEYRHIDELPGYPKTRHAILNIADWVNIDIFVDGELFSISNSKTSMHMRTLDMKQGILKRKFIWETQSGKTVAVKTERLVSMVRRHIGALRCSVNAPETSTVILRSRTQLKMKSSAIAGDHIRIKKMEKDFALLELTTANDQVALSQAYSLDGEKKREETDWIFSCSGRGSIVLDKFISISSTMDGKNFVQLTSRELNAACTSGFNKLKEEQKAFWTQYWNDTDIKIAGSIQDQQAVRFSLFHLGQGNPEKNNRSISANGLTGDGYSGHIFWDTEIFMLPPYIYTKPKTVLPLLEYRYSILPKARERAFQMQGKGALFPWNSVKGEECGHVYEASTAEYHLLSDIARAIELYDRMTSDEEFVLTKGAEILFEMCRFLEDRGCRVKGKGFCLNVVCGPDEYACGVNNNAYTNFMAKSMFEYAVSVYTRIKTTSRRSLFEKINLSPNEVAAWKQAANDMFLPFNTELCLTPQDDSFLEMDTVDMDLIPQNTDIRPLYHPLNLWRMQVIKQADVILLMFLHGDKFNRKIKKNNYHYYEPKTNHGSSLSACIHSIIASEIGLKEEAYNYFRQTALMDINDFKNNTEKGVHSACLGGCWMAVVNGFAGMRDYPEGLEFNPVIPEDWTGYSFPMVYKGSQIRVTVSTKETRYELISGPELIIKSNGKIFELKQEGSYN